MRVLKKDVWPHKVTVNITRENHIDLIEIWLGEQLGTFKCRWNAVYHHNGTDFYFKEDNDATLFALKFA